MFATKDTIPINGNPDLVRAIMRLTVTRQVKIYSVL